MKRSQKDYFFIGLILPVLVLLFTSVAQASALTVEVTDNQGKLLKNAVVYLESKNTSTNKNNSLVEIEQKDKQFNPLVTVVQTGTSVNFPNHDRVRHHVYSFSPAKKFELKLYSGIPANPVLFDKAGTVVLGCNIHDNMLAFVYVVNTPYFVQTDANGIAKLVDIPDGHYQLKVWHYALKSENVPASQEIDINPKLNKLSVKLTINDDSIVPDR
jgi:plastocyanin